MTSKTKITSTGLWPVTALGVKIHFFLMEMNYMKLIRAKIQQKGLVENLYNFLYMTELIKHFCHLILSEMGGVSTTTQCYQRSDSLSVGAGGVLAIWHTRTNPQWAVKRSIKC